MAEWQEACDRLASDHITGKVIPEMQRRRCKCGSEYRIEPVEKIIENSEIAGLPGDVYPWGWSIHFYCEKGEQELDANPDEDAVYQRVEEEHPSIYFTLVMAPSIIAAPYMVEVAEPALVAAYEGSDSDIDFDDWDRHGLYTWAAKHLGLSVEEVKLRMEAVVAEHKARMN